MSVQRDVTRESSRAALIAAVCLVVLPGAIFFGILSRFALNVPMNDDYDALLGFSNHLAGLTSFIAKLSYFQEAQYNEFKLWFEEGAAWLQMALTGHVNFRVLSMAGYGIFLLLAVVLWKMFLPRQKDLTTRLTLFIPAAWLLFQLQYWQTLDWTTGELQNPVALTFGLASIYLLGRGARWKFCAALLCFALAVAGSGSGLLIAPLGFAVLLRSGRIKRAVAWAVVSVLALTLYLVHYQVVAPTGPHRVSLLRSPLYRRPGFILAFIGGVGGYPKAVGAVLCGLALCGFMVYLLWRGYFRRNPVAGYSVLYLLLTAIGVAGIRSNMGLAGAATSRYTIFSAVWAIFAWQAVAEEFVADEDRPVWRSTVFRVALGVAVLFCCAMDVRGVHRLAQRQADVSAGARAFEHPKESSDVLGPAQGNDAAFRKHTGDLVRQAEAMGIYRLPE